MVNMNYKIEAIDGLLQKDCVLAQMYPLIPYKQALLELPCSKLPDQGGLPEAFRGSPAVRRSARCRDRKPF